MAEWWQTRQNDARLLSSAHMISPDGIQSVHKAAGVYNVRRHGGDYTGFCVKETKITITLMLLFPGSQ